MQLIPRYYLAYLEVFRNGNLAAARNILQNIPTAHLSSGAGVLARWDLAMLERDYVAAEKILTDFPSKYLFEPEIARKHSTRVVPLSPAATCESAQRYFAATLPALEGRMREDPDDPDAPR